MLKLNLGAGSCPLEGYENLDRKTGQEIYPLSQYADESVDEIRASHVLEHFPHGQTLDVLKEWLRVLRPGGVLKIAVPDFKWIAEHYLQGHNIPVQGYTMGGQTDADDYHKTIFDRELLTNALLHLGMVDIVPWQSEIQDCAALPVSLNVQASKPEPLPPMKVAGAMSVPRLGFQDNFYCWANGLAPYGIFPYKYDGAFWGQCLERVMEEQLEADWILTIDYDSVFDKRTVGSLLRLAARHPEADAIAPIQVKRGGGTPLMTIRGDDGNLRPQIAREEFDVPLLKADTAHFGLTLIRTSALRKMTHPWFLGIPDAEGKWGNGRIDDDIHFWRKWKETGNSLYVAPHVVIGHIQAMVAWPDDSFNVIYQNPGEFWESGQPENVWR